MTGRQRVAPQAAMLVALAGTVSLGVLSLQASAAPVKVTPRTAAVQRGTIQSTTAATGNVQAGSAVSVGFGTAGKITQILVKVGDSVAAGQTVATLDSTAAANAVAQATTDLATANRKLANLQTAAATTTTTTAKPSTTPALTAAVQAASKTLTDTVASVAADNATAAAKVDGATKERDAAQATLDRDRNAAGPTPTDAQRKQISEDQAALDNAQAALGAALAAKDKKASDGAAKVAAASQSLDKAIAALASSTQQSGGSSSAGGTATTASQDLLDAASSGVTQAQNKLNDAQTALAACTLTAPAGGTVTALTAVVGQQVTAAGVTAASTSSSSGSGGSGSGGSASSFLTITDFGALQVKSALAEADVAKVKVGQPVSIAFDALPDVTLVGKVLTVSNTSTVSSNVVSFDTLISLVKPPPSVRSGMSATATIVTASRDDVLRVPTAAVRGAGSNGIVTVLANGTQSIHRVVLGMRGDDATEIISGVSVGDQVVTASVTSGGSTATTRAGQQRNGATPGGFGGFGGGGGGPVFVRGG